VLKHPHLRIKRRTDDLPPGGKDAPIHAIKLIKKVDSPTRIKRKPNNGMDAASTPDHETEPQLKSPSRRAQIWEHILAVSCRRLR